MPSLHFELLITELIYQKQLINLILITKKKRRDKSRLFNYFLIISILKIKNGLLLTPYHPPYHFFPCDFFTIHQNTRAINFSSKPSGKKKSSN